MLDSGATSNFTNQTFLKKLDLETSVPILQAFCMLFGYALRIYNQHELALQATNTTNCTIGTAGTFIAVNLKRVYMVLKLSWLIQWNVAIHPHNQKWWFYKQTDVIAYITHDVTNGQIVSIPKPS